VLVCNLRGAAVTRVVGNADRRDLHSLFVRRARGVHFIEQSGEKERRIKEYTNIKLKKDHVGIQNK
jgi:hypothetical protein